MFRPPITPDPNAHIGPRHGPWPEDDVARYNREVLEFVADHPYSYGGPCGGCGNRACNFIDDSPDHDMSYGDHLMEKLGEHLDVNWRRVTNGH